MISKRKLSDLFDIAKSSYYYGIKTKPIDIEQVKIKALIHQIFKDSKQSARAHTIIAILANECDIKLTRYVATTLMKQMSLISRQLKSYKYKQCDEEHRTHDNLKAAFYYLVVVLDLYARRIVGLSISY